MKIFKFVVLIIFLSSVIFTQSLSSKCSSQEKESETNGVDIIVISNNCPIKLYACLESIKTYVDGYNKIFVFYSASDEKFEDAYKCVALEFHDVNMSRLNTGGENSSLKPSLHCLLKKIKSEYIAVTVDDVTIKDFVNFEDCISALEKSKSYGFCLTLGQNITQDPLVSLEITEQIGGNIVAWKICDSVKGLFTRIFDMVIYNKKVILNNVLRVSCCKKTKGLKAVWASFFDKKSVACFRESKAVSVTPIVLQNESKEEEIGKDFLNNKLLYIFNSGFKININTFYGMNNKSANISYEVSFVPRKDETENLWKKLKNKKTKEDKHFVFIIASYNNKQWYKPNLDSVFSQKYKNYHVIYTDAASPDGTGKLVEQYIKERKLENKILLIKNVERCGALENIYRAIQMCDDNDIVILLDGDDWLAHDHVLDLLNKVYDAPNIWLTYGDYKVFPQGASYCRDIPCDVVTQNKYREFRWCASHLRTFYAWLFKKISIDDLKYENKFFPMAWDLAIMFPMLEMAGGKFMFIRDILYIYNYDNSLNDCKVNKPLQMKLDKYIRALPKYDKLQ